MLPPITTRIDLRQRRDQIGHDHDLYMRRRQFFAVRIGARIVQLRLHTIFRRDTDENPHDHPFAFVSWIVRGGYHEQLYDVQGTPIRGCVRRRWSLGWRAKDCVHNITDLIEGKPVTTLVLAVFDTRDDDYGAWGFVENGKWVHKDIYLGRTEQNGRRVKPAAQ